MPAAAGAAVAGAALAPGGPAAALPAPAAPVAQKRKRSREVARSLVYDRLKTQVRAVVVRRGARLPDASSTPTDRSLDARLQLDNARDEGIFGVVLLFKKADGAADVATSQLIRTIVTPRSRDAEDIGYALGDGATLKKVLDGIVMRSPKLPELQERVAARLGACSLPGECVWLPRAHVRASAGGGHPRARPWELKRSRTRVWTMQ